MINLNFLFDIGVWVVDSVVLVRAHTQQRFSDSHSCMCPFSNSFPIWVVTVSEESSLRSTVGPCWLNILIKNKEERKLTPKR